MNREVAKKGSWIELIELKGLNYVALKLKHAENTPVLKTEQLTWTYTWPRNCKKRIQV